MNCPRNSDWLCFVDIEPLPLTQRRSFLRPGTPSLSHTATYKGADIKMCNL